MSSSINTLFEKCTKHAQDEHLKNKIRLSIRVGVFTIIMLGLPFLALSLVYYQELLYIPVIGIVIFPVILFFMAQGAHITSRVLFSTLPLSLSVLYHCVLVKAGDPPIAALTQIQLAVALIPFLIFNTEEKYYIVSCTIWNSVLILSFPFANEMLSLNHLQDAPIRNGVLTEFISGSALVMAFGYMIALLHHSKILKHQNEMLVTRMQKQQETLSQSEQRLRENLNKLEENQKEDEKRKWADAGLSKFAALFRNSEDKEMLGDTIVTELVHYLKVNQAGLFLVKGNEEEKYIELISCFAYNRKKYISKRIEIGQGLLGQAYLEKDYIYLREIPDNYIHITSGLGDAPPQTLLIVPLLFNESVIGLIELASFRPLKEYEIDFVKNLGEIIASSLHNKKLNEQTQNLLTEAQEQTEMLQAQEEEMRQNMEELSATQEDMHRKEKEYLNRIHSLENELKKTKAHEA